MVIDIVVAGGIGTVLCGAIGVLYKRLIALNDDIRVIEKDKLNMLMEEAKSNKELAIQFMKGEGNVISISEKIDSVDKKIETILKLTNNEK